MKKNTSKQSIIDIRVLQNGIPIAEYSQNANKKAHIYLSNKNNEALSIPFYPMLEDIALFEISKGAIQLTIDHNWQGFVVMKNQLEIVNLNHKKDFTCQLKLLDYGAVCYKDLRVLFKVKLKEKAIKNNVKKLSQYASNPFDLIFHNKHEVIGFTTSILSSMIIITLLYFLISSVQLNRPKAFTDLSQKYTLPFIDDQKLKTSPEALQFKLNRDNFVGSAAKFYHTLTDVMLGWDAHDDEQFILEPIKDYYREIHVSNKDKQFNLFQLQERIDQLQLNKQGTGVLKIPSIVGESIDSKLLNLFDKFSEMQTTFHTTLEQRRKLSIDFLSDEPYDWGNVGGGSEAEKRKRLEYLSKIRVFQEHNNEQLMYKEAEDLAILTSLINYKLYKDFQDEFLQKKDIDPIIIERVSPHSSFILNVENFSLEDKIEQIQASKWGSQIEGGSYREPLIGEVDAALIKKTIDKNQFQLQLCYELILRNKEVRPISMDWQWRIDTRGKILDLVLLTSSIDDKKLSDCIYRKMAKWTFPRPRNGSIEVSHTFNFIPRRE